MFEPWKPKIVPAFISVSKPNLDAPAVSVFCVATSGFPATLVPVLSTEVLPLPVVWKPIPQPYSAPIEILGHKKYSAPMKPRTPIPIVVPDFVSIERPSGGGIVVQSIVP